MTANSKRLSLNEIRARVAKFAVDYRQVRTEKQHTGDFWKAFMRCYGVEDSFLHGVTFEYPARRSDTGGTGYIDVFMPGQYLIEQKTDGKISRTKGSELSNAEQQANAYLTGGDITPAQMPRWVITSDFATVQITDLSVPRQSPVRTRNYRTADLAEDVEAFLFLTGEDSGELIAEEQTEASIAAARLMGDLYAALTGDDDTDGSEIVNPEEEDDATMAASVLLTRLLFLMFGDDAGLWPRGLFQRFIETRTSSDGSDLGQQLAALFNVLDTPEPRDKRMDEALREFPHVNGSLFSRGDTTMMWFDTAMRDALVAACRFDWSRISPAVFGSLFQTVKSKAARGSDGEHYTSEANILKTLRPMFLDDLRKRLDLANTKPALEALHEELKSYRYVDPACGCGNFLIVAYREMRALELDLLTKLRAKRGHELELMIDPSHLLNVRLDQFYGIELNWWPAKIAETAMFLVDHQANGEMEKRLGFKPPRLPIEVAAKIHHGNALTDDWNLILPPAGPKVWIFGNPPFLGRSKRSKEQARELAAAWGVKNAGHLDLVTAWFARAAEYLTTRAGEFGFVATNSITQGEPVIQMFPRLSAAGWRIKFAHRTFAWDSETAAREKAAVHCVVIGFTRDASQRRRLFHYQEVKGPPTELSVKQGINGYLVDGPEVYAAKRTGGPLSPALPAVGYGSMPNDGGHLIIDSEELEEVMRDPLAAKYVREFLGSRELIRGTHRWCLWLTELDPADVSRSAILRARLEAVRDARLASKNPETWPHAETPHLFWFINQPEVPYLAIPEVFSDNRPYATVKRLPTDVIVSNKVYVCPDPDGFAFAVISSSMFITWQKTIGGRLKSDPSFSASIVWNNLPLPEVDADLRSKIAEAGAGVLEARQHFDTRSLAELYHPLAMSKDLVTAHRRLDKLVDAAFGHGDRAATMAQRQVTLFERLDDLQSQPA